ncbi:hypothetical protein [Paraburkholderia diazotrophica]|uniref:Uncharacterized protein n=1 Tax=Paraburkholderia diazotrophica TaxID=667676 RepID=A0A1H7BB35_9BURK|nr:hypothetical protein [Paraburkholderia diazotrophica]SEJ74658.1 hypothetical protein SAMN05192539_101752 [Paraburkholderia diazotrophica]
MKVISIRRALLACAVGVSCAGATGTAFAQNMLSPQKAAALRMAAIGTKKRTPGKPFAFRGIALGITLDEFRAIGRVRATPPGSVPVCETDGVAGALGMRLKTSRSLTVACRWAHREANGWEVSRAVVDGAPADEHVLRFVRVDGESAFRLYEISFVIDEITADDLRDAFEDRYGAPRISTQTESTTTRMLPVYIWENDVSSITLCLLPATHNATLTYLLKDPDAYIKSVVRQWQVGSPDAG